MDWHSIAEQEQAKVERLTAERDALRAELAAEREKTARMRVYATTQFKLDAVTAERDALHELLREAREAIDAHPLSLRGELIARINAALTNGCGDE